MSSAPTSTLRQILDSRFAQLSTEMEGLFAEARERGRRESADQLNQAVRRIRQSADIEELRAILLDTASAFATGAALLRIEGQVAKAERIRGVPEEIADAIRALEIPLLSAAALAGAVQTRDPVIAANSPGEVSEALLKLIPPADAPAANGGAGDAPDLGTRLADQRLEGRVWIFPVLVREDVLALVYAWGSVQGSAIELLSHVAAAVWSDLQPPPPPPSPAIPEPMVVEPIAAEPAVAAPIVADLVQIAPAAPVAPSPQPAPADAWDRLPRDEQRIHLRAQRFARVKAAEISLQEADAVQSGRAQGDLYVALRKPIDAARAAFRQSFFAPCASMVDYLHLELVRTLANDNPELLGKDYPGPLV